MTSRGRALARSHAVAAGSDWAYYGQRLGSCGLRGSPGLWSRPAAFLYFLGGSPVAPWDAVLMHILYVDDSATVEDPNERHFVLGAVSVFERGLYHQIKAADDCVGAFGLGDP
jgi:hypothetical protein